MREPSPVIRCRSCESD